MSEGSPGSELPRDLEDRLVRESLCRAENLRTFLRLAVPQWAEGFRCEGLRPLSREYFTPNWFSREADLPLQVPYQIRDREVQALVCVFIEHQSGTDPLLPLRMLFYAVCYWMKQLHEYQDNPEGQGPFQLGPVLPIVLYTAPRPWGSNRSVRDLYQGPEEFQGFVPDWAPLFWNLSERTAQELSATREGWAQLLAVMRAENAPRTEFAQVFAGVLEVLAPLAGENLLHWQELLGWVWRYATWKRPQEERAPLQQQVQQAHPDRASEVQAMTQTIAQELIAQGLQEGRAEGLREGELRTQRANIKQVLRIRFGSIAAELEQRLEQIQQVEVLQQIFEQALKIQSLDELQL
jgi:hypothetical protein